MRPTGSKGPVPDSGGVLSAGGCLDALNPSNHPEVGLAKTAAMCNGRLRCGADAYDVELPFALESVPPLEPP